MVIDLLKDATSAVTGKVIEIEPTVNAGAGTGVVQGVITGTATVEIQGSLNGEDWFAAATMQSSGGSAITLPVYVRAKVTSYTSGNVSAMIQLPANWVQD